jgi:hypothetical protein
MRYLKLGIALVVFTCTTLTAFAPPQKGRPAGGVAKPEVGGIRGGISGHGTGTPISGGHGGSGSSLAVGRDGKVVNISTHIHNEISYNVKTGVNYFSSPAFQELPVSQKILLAEHAAKKFFDPLRSRRFTNDDFMTLREIEQSSSFLSKPTAERVKYTISAFEYHELNAAVKKINDGLFSEASSNRNSLHLATHLEPKQLKIAKELATELGNHGLLSTIENQIVESSAKPSNVIKVSKGASLDPAVERHLNAYNTVVELADRFESLRAGKTLGDLHAEIRNAEGSLGKDVADNLLMKESALHFVNGDTAYALKSLPETSSTAKSILRDFKAVILSTVSETVLSDNQKTTPTAGEGGQMTRGPPAPFDFLIPEALKGSALPDIRESGLAGLPALKVPELVELKGKMALSLRSEIRARKAEIEIRLRDKAQETVPFRSAADKRYRDLLATIHVHPTGQGLSELDKLVAEGAAVQSVPPSQLELSIIFYEHGITQYIICSMWATAFGCPFPPFLNIENMNERNMLDIIDDIDR